MKNKTLRFGLILLVIISSLTACFSVKNMQLTPDSMGYALVSQQIHSGNGIRIPITFFDSKTPPDADGTVPFLVQPPLYPIILAIFGSVKPDHLFAARLLNILCLVVLVILTTRLTSNYLSNTMALIVGICVATAFSLLKITHLLWSESLFITLIVLTIFLLSQSRKTKHTRIFILLAGLSAAAATLTRFAGLALVALFFWEMMVSVKNKLWKSNKYPILASILLQIITIGLLFKRNYLLAGTIRGFAQPSPERSIMEAFSGTIKMIFVQFTSTSMTFSPRGFGIKSSVLIVFFLFIVSLIIFNRNSWKKLKQYLQSGFDHILIFVISYTMLITYGMVKNQPHFELRFMTPVAPFLFIISIAIVGLLTNMNTKPDKKIVKTACFIFVLILCLGNLANTHSKLFYFQNSNEYTESFLQSETYQWVAGNFDRETKITTNNSTFLSFYGNYPTLQLPTRGWNRNVRIPEHMDQKLPQRMAETGARILVLFTDDDNLNPNDFGTYIHGLWQHPKNESKLILVKKFRDGILYRLPPS